MSANLTTRNQLQGTVSGVTIGAVVAEIKVDVQGDEFVAVITKHSAERLGLADGDAVTVLIKATEVMLAKGSIGSVQLTTRNQIPGKVEHIEKGAVMAEATIATGAGEIVAAVTRHSVERLGLSDGDDVTVLVKATEVMLAK
jgi:molybdate transport system regulatory protein